MGHLVAEGWRESEYELVGEKQVKIDQVCECDRINRIMSFINGTPTTCQVAVERFGC